MRWFRRRSTDPVAADVPATPDVDLAEAARVFWCRWAELLPELSAALGDREPHRVEHALCAAVAAFHPHLHVSLDRGQRAIYALVVSGQEDPALRPYTDAWKAAAPPDDPLWEYHDSVPPVPDPNGVTVNLGGHRIGLADVRVAVTVDAAEHVLDVAVYHPALAELDEAGRAAMTFLPLDATLGERVAGERLRRVRAVLTPPADPIPLVELRSVVARLADPARERLDG